MREVRNLGDFRPTNTRPRPEGELTMHDALILGESLFWLSLTLVGGAFLLRSMTRRPDPWR